VVDALGALARAPRADPVAATFWLVAAESSFHHHAADEAAATRSIEEARALAERLGVRGWDSPRLTQAIAGALVRDDAARAQDALAGLRAAIRPGNPYDLCHLRVFEGLVALRRGRFAEVTRLAGEAKALGERIGFALVHVLADLTLARACAGSGDREGAASALAAARTKIDGSGALPFEHVAALVEADHARRAHRPEVVGAALARAASCAREGGVRARYLFSGDELAILWGAALRSGVATGEVRALVRDQGLRPPADAGEEWPWPVRVKVLGPLAVEREGVAVDARRARKQLALLRAIVALGGKDVPESAAADALWPEAEADAAEHVLEVTLSRLRRLVGADAIVRGTRRAISIAPERCWVDALALEAHLAAALARLDRPGSLDREAIRRDGELLARLYRGPLFDGEGEPWAVLARGRLRRRIGRWLERAGGVAGAAAASSAIRDRLATVDPELAAPALARLA
jgi:hypothetical protein